MTLYLPIAEMSVSVLLLILMGGVVGFISGLFGVGGGFLLTPALIFLGVPPPIAVASQASQIAASSLSSALSHWRLKRVDIHLGNTLLVGSMAGACGGIVVFSLLRAAGQLDLVISVGYVVLLGSIGLMLVLEQVTLPRILKTPKIRFPELTVFGRFFHTHFEVSDVRHPIMLVIGLGVCIGFLGTILGIGGAFVLIPALVYGLKVPTRIAVGTALYQTVVTMCFASLLHAITNQTVDILLALLLMIGGVVGAQYGTQVGQNVKVEHLRMLLGVVVLAAAIRFLMILLQEPTEYFTLF